MKPDFKAMSRKELRAYILKHRDDDEAFYAYMDKLEAEATWVEFPAPKSIDDLKNFPELLEKYGKLRPGEL
ncbi:DUF6887 family protein [Microseira wollei]|uniref:Uncharacterized protein n=1 Tax=Microseira wollei NIES-4236 TaxID=2530354 RepID=A0AAV3XJ01_9CYAN|nr:hypothetical protein [Microseira wollei]GET42439.1 hypothetical protein MiSe_72560 [Microseira wollei NIES-4236]